MNIMNSELETAASEFKKWFITDALPLWSSTAINAATGASYERLLSNGQPDLECNVRVRVQARQIFVFCLAQELGWIKSGKQIVDKMTAFVHLHGRHASGHGYVHLLNAANEVVDDKQDLYDHAFHILANIWNYRVFKNESALLEAEAIYTFLDEKFSSENGGWLEGDYASDRRRQNPHMHLFEAFIAGYEATKDKVWLDRATSMFSLFEKYFYDNKHGVLLEYFNEDWSPLDGKDGSIIEPGHMMEWVWLLRNYSRLSGVNVDIYADTLYKNAINMGMSEGGLLYDELLLDGSIEKGSKRCWPMTELVKASIAQASAGKSECEALALKAIQELKATYLSVSTRGAYIDQLDADNNIVADVAPASTLYHLIVAAAEVCSYLEK